MGKTNIEWSDKVWNPCSGCTKVSAGCKNCYAERAFKWVYPGRKFTDVQCHPERLDQPLHWRKPSMVFVNSMSDLFHPDVSLGFIGRVLVIIRKCPQHTFQILTKRAQRMKWIFETGSPPDNVWHGVSIENQKTADERIPILLRIPAAVRFVSCEPLLGPVYIQDYVDELDWIIVGGESGSSCRPMQISWAHNLRIQAWGAGKPYFMKQLGGWPDKRSKLEDLPPDLRIREYPKSNACRL